MQQLFFAKLLFPKGEKLPKVQLNTPAPDFTLNDFKDQPVRLADFRGGKNVVLVFNRGFL